MPKQTLICANNQNVDAHIIIYLFASRMIHVSGLLNVSPYNYVDIASPEHACLRIIVIPENELTFSFLLFWLTFENLYVRVKLSRK